MTRYIVNVETGKRHVYAKTTTDYAHSYQALCGATVRPENAKLVDTETSHKLCRSCEKRLAK